MRLRFSLLTLLFLSLFLVCWRQSSAQVLPPHVSTVQNRLDRASHASTLAELHRKYHSNFILHGPEERREVALSFDDAPDRNYTAQILDVLKREHVKATFFIVGRRAERYPEMVHRIQREGHAIGNHSYSHANLPKLKKAAFRLQIRLADQVLQQLIGYQPVIVRPPYGNVNEPQLRWLIGQHRKIVNWNVDSLDWKSLPPKKIVTNILMDIRPGAIILQHAGGGRGEELSGTIKALPQIIHTLRADGMRFVTIPEMLSIDNQMRP